MTKITDLHERWLESADYREAYNAMEPINYDDLDPGIRDVVIMLRNAGFNTCDSGDGSKANTMACAVEYPHVAALTEPDAMIEQSKVMLALLREHDLRWCVDASYGAHDGQAILYAYLLNDEGAWSS